MESICSTANIFSGEDQKQIDFGSYNQDGHLREVH